MKKQKKKYPKSGRSVTPRDHKAKKATKYAYPGRHGGRHTAREVELVGKFTGNERGFGFLLPDDGTEDVFIPASVCGGAIDGDRVRVLATATQSQGGRREGRVVEILERERTALIGTLIEQEYMRSGRYVTRYAVVPDSRRFDFVAHVDDTGAAEVGDKVFCEFDPDTYRPAYRDRDAHVKGYVVRSFGAAHTRDANYEAILADCGIECEFDEETLAGADRAAKTPLDRSNRRLREEIVFTIDGADAKDLDDAVSITRTEDGGYVLGVHIADVAEYVRPRTALDRTAKHRGTSVYFVDKVVPMLPQALSNGACSLNAGEEKYTLSAIITLDEDGKILDTKLEESIIVSRVRGVYSEVNDVIEQGEASEFFEKYREVAPSLSLMHELYAKLAARSAARGAIDFDAPEAYFVLGDDGNIREICRRERGVAERLIEQFMLCANEAVATLLTKRDIPCVYRVHEEPPREKLTDFITYAHNLGLDTSRLSRATVGCADFSALLREAKEAELLDAVSTPMLRAMAKAKYSEVPMGHFGLGIGLYCHFTSPIRRYSDTVTHRIVKDVLLGGKAPERYRSSAARAAAAATEGELRALDAERKIEDLYKTIYMSSRIGESFDAQISSIGSFGMFCTLENTCEGLVPLREMAGYFIFDEGNLTLTSGNTVYRIGDAVRVKVEEASVTERRVRFSLEEDAGAAPRTYALDTPKPRNHRLREAPSRKKATRPKKSGYTKKKRR